MNYIRKSSPVEAIQFTGSNDDEVKAFLGDRRCKIHRYANMVYVEIEMIVGSLYADTNDYIVRENGKLSVWTAKDFERHFQKGE